MAQDRAGFHLGNIALEDVPIGSGIGSEAAPGILMSGLRADPAEAPALSSELVGLSSRGRDILALIGDGLTNREIGKKLHLSEKTVENRVSRLPAKRRVQRRDAGQPARTA